ncbi:MAG: ribonuclease Y, partial [Clostridia bacterium]|nr:ribonuclease Y [Clostridia bacterium]
MDKLLFALIGLAVGVLACLAARAVLKKKDQKTLSSAQSEAKRIVSEAVQSAAATKKDAILEAKEQVLAIKTEAENELKERRKEVSRQERRIAQKEENLDSKTEALEKKEAAVQKKQESLEAEHAEIEEIKKRQMEALEKISGLSVEEAKGVLLKQVEGEISHETALKISEYEERFKEEAEEKAKNLLSVAIQRCAADHVSEVAISTVPLPSEEMKGRIIGREGRNIRAIEQQIGVELIIDDTREVITVSGFDPIRRETGRIALEKLIADGRIHPARIEEMVEKARKEVENSMKQAGEKAVFETGVRGLNPELVRLLGRLKFRTSYGQNVLKHSVEVSMLAGMMAEEIGVDSAMAKRAGLLHDIGKAMTQEAEGSHIELGVEIAKKYHENKDIIHAIEAHHGDVDPKTPLAFLIQAADAISAARPGARRDD